MDNQENKERKQYGVLSSQPVRRAMDDMRKEIDRMTFSGQGPMAMGNMRDRPMY